jgi:hypothetical protein
MIRGSFAGRLLTAVAVFGGLAGGCVQPAKPEVKMAATIPARYAGQARIIQADPVGFLRQVADRCDKLQQYRMTFYRQERVGALVQSLSPMEQIRAAFRKEPFSVKFEWESPDSDFYESVYVAGQNDNKLLIRERKGIFPFPPQVRAIDPALPAKLGKARNPITDFGLARVTRRTLLPFDDAALAKVMTLQYEGVTNLEPTGRPAHHLHIERPPTPGYAYVRQDFYIDADTLLPAGTDLWLKNGDLGARYRYADIQTEVKLTDADFLLAQDHPAHTASQ